MKRMLLQHYCSLSFSFISKRFFTAIILCVYINDSSRKRLSKRTTVNMIVFLVLILLTQDAAAAKQQNDNSITLMPSKTISKETLLAEIPIWGPTFKVSLDIYINSLKGMGELLRFTSTEKNCCDYGDRILAIFANKKSAYPNGYLIYRNNNIFWWKDAKKFEEKKWYKLEMTQNFQGKKVTLDSC